MNEAGLMNEAAPLTDDELREVRQQLHDRVPAFAARVAPLYVLLQWEWAAARGDGRDGIPRERDIARTLRDLIDGATEYTPGEGVYASTGGLSIQAQRYQDNSGFLCRLIFQVEDV